MPIKEWKRRFANKILQRLGELDMTQEELALKTGVDPTTISKYLSCERVPNVIIVINMSYALECNVAWLTGTGIYVERN